MALPIQKSAARTAPLLIHKSAAKLCRCRFRNRQPTMSLPIQRSKNQKLRRCRFRDGQPKTLPLLIQKSTAKNCTVADSEISSQKLCCCLFRNRQWELRHYRPINQKLNCAAANSEISNQLGRCRFRDRQPKTASLPIQKSAMRTVPVPTHKLVAKLCRCRCRDRQPKTMLLPI